LTDFEWILLDLMAELENIDPRKARTYNFDMIYARYEHKYIAGERHSFSGHKYTRGMGLKAMERLISLGLVCFAPGGHRVTSLPKQYRQIGITVAPSDIQRAKKAIKEAEAEIQVDEESK